MQPIIKLDPGDDEAAVREAVRRTQGKHVPIVTSETLGHIVRNKRQFIRYPGERLTWP